VVTHPRPLSSQKRGEKKLKATHPRPLSSQKRGEKKSNSKLPLFSKKRGVVEDRGE